jgi:NhaP-type Na+/H+ or K+/H+ antiporter
VRIVSTLSLTLVLFTDAVTLNVAEVRRHSGLALLVLGPGTLLSTALVALVAWWLLGLSLAAAILGAALASTDPVLLRGVLNGPDLPAAARQALRLESGLNDVVLLLVVLVAMPFLDPATVATSIDWARMTLSLFVLGPGAGIALGLLAIAALDWCDGSLGYSGITNRSIPLVWRLPPVRDAATFALPPSAWLIAYCA